MKYYLWFIKAYILLWGIKVILVDKSEFLKVISKSFKLKSEIAFLSKPDFDLKSRIFYYTDIFKDIDEIKILTVRSTNEADDIEFSVYYIRHEFENLYTGYFKIIPKSANGEKMFYGVSKVCTNLSEYLYYVYQNSEFLKVYIISGTVASALEQSEKKIYSIDFEKIKKNTYLEMSKYSFQEFQNILLKRDYLVKYLTNFIKFNKKCSSIVKMFFINILSPEYKDNICFINNCEGIETYIKVNSEDAVLNSDTQISLYCLLECAAKNKFPLFLKLEDDFKGGN